MAKPASSFFGPVWKSEFSSNEPLSLGKEHTPRTSQLLNPALTPHAVQHYQPTLASVLPQKADIHMHIHGDDKENDETSLLAEIRPRIAENQEEDKDVDNFRSGP